MFHVSTPRVTLIAGMAAALILPGETLIQAQGAAKNPVATRPEDVYVVRARPSGPEVPVTTYCAAANFPASHPVQRERPYEFFSTSTNAKDGKLLDGAIQPLGGFRGCYSARIDGMTYSYGRGTLNGIPFTVRGSCCSTSPSRAWTKRRWAP